ncbi:uncharacterized protein NPIL_646751 [Nephila pilipes]|uniref:Uncharacterized protein n=1 Tax=Nephila pilipes TaxID=299642 RepID=A0A8X6UTU9_NEPPI|nr:uncharacterized protein NPIL_646751 [Nephila pilipes]
MALKSIPVLSLRHMAMLKIAIHVCNDPDIQKFLKKNGVEPSIFPSRESQIFLEKVGREMEPTSTLDREGTWAWKSVLSNVKYLRHLNFTYVKNQTSRVCDMKKGTLPFKSWEDLVEKKISSFSLPPMLQSEFFDIIRSVTAEIDQWIKDHHRVLFHYLHEERSVYCYFQWNSLGKIDREETARTLLTIEGLHPEDYFYVAINYGFMDQLLTFMYGRTPEKLVDCSNCAGLMWEDFPTKRDLMSMALTNSSFQSLASQLDSPLRTRDENLEIINSVMSRIYIQYEEFLLCLSKISDDEKEIIFIQYPLKILMYFLDWPLQSEFLETAERLLPYLTVDDFRDTLKVILYERILLGRKDFHYIDLLKEFWSMIPQPFKQLIMTDLMYKSLMYTINYPSDEIFPHEKLFEHFSGNGLMYTYRGAKYILMRIEESSKRFETLKTVPYTSNRDNKLFSTFYVCKLRPKYSMEIFEQELKIKKKQNVPEFITKLRDLFHWRPKRTGI